MCAIDFGYIHLAVNTLSYGVSLEAIIKCKNILLNNRIENKLSIVCEFCIIWMEASESRHKPMQNCDGI